MNQNTKQKRSAASWLLELSKGRYGEYALSVLAALLGVACSLAPYFIIIRLITALVNGTAELFGCLTLCAWMAGFWVLRYALHSVSTSLSHHATFHVLAGIRIRLLDKLDTLPLGTVLDRSSGSYKNIIVERVDAIETTLAHLLPEMTSNIVGALAVLVLLFLEDWRMGLSMLIVVPLGVLCFMSMFSGYNEKFQRTVTATKALNDTAVEYISGIEVIKAFGQSKTSYAKFVSAAKEGADCFIDWMRGSLFGQVAGMAIFPSTLLGILPVGCLLHMHGTLSSETFLAVIVLSFGVMQPLITVFSYTDDIVQVKTIIGEVAEFIGLSESERTDMGLRSIRSDEIKIPECTFMQPDPFLAVRHLSVKRNKQSILHDFSLSANNGDIIGIVGKNGSGKSTFCNSLCGLLPTVGGEVIFRSRKLSRRARIRQFGMVMQDVNHQLFSDSVKNECLSANPNATDHEIENLLNSFDLLDCIDRHPLTLSGGQRQRLAICQAIMGNKKFLIFDEPTSGLDFRHMCQVTEWLKQLAQHGYILFVVTHDYEFLNRACNCYVRIDKIN